ncbi:MAG: hypothetical protein AB7I27_10550 [Bacteriovoracaceae bacterium]
MKYIILMSLFLSSAYAIEFGNLKPEDQKYYKNDIFEGNNQRERIDSLVKEVNKIYGEMASMKSEIQQLKVQIEELKKAK